MLDVFEHNICVGAVGPKFLFPDGTLQEVGAYILPEGWPIQLGKDQMVLPASYVDGIQVIDYCSAACLLVKKSDFLSLGGFDPVFDPGYYEDSDLAIRLRSVGLFSYYCGQAVVFHELNATSRRIWTNEQLMSHILNSQRIFETRWGDYLRRRINESCEPDAFPRVNWQPEGGPNGKRRFILYSSNPVKASEASRRLLLVACAFQDSYDVIIASDEAISRCRVYSLCREFKIELNSFRTRKISDIPETDTDLMITFDIDGRTYGLFKRRLSFECDDNQLLDLLECTPTQTSGPT
jgi:hypothetical protein